MPRFQRPHMNEVPGQSEWADEALSKQLPALRAQGEGQNLEFMAAFPSNTHELAREIAAFATSNSGIILIGVDDEGSTLGIEPSPTTADRDLLLRRVEGICHRAVKPSITPRAKFAREENRVVLVLTIPKGSQPVYYAKDVPYVRHITSSRPAEPHEVIDLIQGTIQSPLRARPSEVVHESPDRRAQWFANLMQGLSSVVILGEEFEYRMVSPWLDHLRAQFGNVASELRDAAAGQTAVDEGLDAKLTETAAALDHIAKLHLHLGSGPELTRAVKEGLEKAKSLLEKIRPEITPHVSSKQLREELVVLQRQLSPLGRQAKDASQNGSIEELQARATEMGLKILNIAQYGVNRLSPGLESALSEVGHQLHLAETERFYLDGGVSVARLIERVTSAVALFDKATETTLG